MAQILADAGYAVTCASDGAEGLSCLSSGHIDITLLDLRMPRTDGLTFLREAYRLNPEMPVLILTGHADLPSAVEALRLRARDYIQKPVHPEQLLPRIEQVLTEAESPRRRRALAGHIRELMAELEELESGEKGPQRQLKRDAASQAAQPQGRFLRRGSLVLDLESRTLSFNSRTVPLPATGFAYLTTLVRHAPEPVDIQALVLESQGYKLSRAEAQEMARWWVHQIRKAIEEDASSPKLIQTIRGVGYRLAID